MCASNGDALEYFVSKRKLDKVCVTITSVYIPRIMNILVTIELKFMSYINLAHHSLFAVASVRITFDGEVIVAMQERVDR